MPAPSKRPAPPARMVELLVIRKRELLEENGGVTIEDFDVAWEECWQAMVTERAWPHATAERRSWRSAMLAARPETMACFLGRPTGFHTYLAALADAMDRSVAADPDLLVGALVA